MSTQPLLPPNSGPGRMKPACPPSWMRKTLTIAGMPRVGLTCTLMHRATPPVLVPFCPDRRIGPQTPTDRRGRALPAGIQAPPAATAVASSPCRAAGRPQSHHHRNGPARCPRSGCFQDTTACGASSRVKPVTTRPPSRGHWSGCRPRPCGCRRESDGPSIVAPGRPGRWSGPIASEGNATACGSSACAIRRPTPRRYAPGRPRTEFGRRMWPRAFS
jgi:hypothetical protein